MNKLRLMTLRDINSNKGQYIAVILVVVIGITLYNAVLMSYQSLSNSIEYYYEEYRLPHLFAKFIRSSESIVAAAERIDGVAAAQGRLVLDVPMELPGFDDKIQARFVSVPASNDNALNRLYLEEGRYVSGSFHEAALVDKLFMEAHDLETGSTLYPIINGKKIQIVIAGKAVSPEYIYPVPSSRELMPDNERFTIIYLEHGFMQQLFGYEGMVNEVVVRLKDEALTGEIKKELEYAFKHYGLISVGERDDQASYMMMDNELMGLEAMGYSYPMIFLLIGSIVIYMLLLRLVDNQRRQIGVLMALGFTKRAILFHYQGYALFVGFAGSILGGLLGIWLSGSLTRYYLVFFNVPVLQVKIYASVIIIGIVLSVVFCGIAGLNAAKRVLRIAPAEAMRPMAPVEGKKWWGERILPFLARLKISWRLTFRNMWRNKKRTLFTLFAIAMTVGLMISILMLLDSVELLFDKAFGDALSYDYKINFTRDVHRGIIEDLGEFREISSVEPIAEYPFRLKNGWRQKETLVTGIQRGSALYGLFDLNGNRTDVPVEGILLTEGLAKSLGVKPGDTIMLESLYKPETEQQVVVKGLVEQYMGGSGFMEIGSLIRAMKEGSTINSALIKIRHGSLGFVKELEDMAYVQSVKEPDDMVKQYNEYMDIMYAYIGVIVAMSCIMGFAIIYNTTTISIMERKRELASLRIMGFTNNQVAEIIFNENTAVSILGLLVGMPLGRLIGAQIIEFYPEDVMTLPLVVFPKTYIIAAATVALFVILAQLANMRRISRMDLVEVMKSRE
ncbi:MAG: FtsX-like permease family protein [Bacillota bacterium]|nr:FtsX-like permease family protein [Bacillota bacterium]MDD3298184.1 FtsX-like permease family protein [Bacillota bacterium]